MTDLVPVFDGHNDTILKLEIAARLGSPMDFSESNPMHDLDLPRARAGGFVGGFFAMFTPSHLDRFDHAFDPSDPVNFDGIDQESALDFTLSMFARLRRLAHQFPDDLSICDNALSVRAAIATNRIAIVPHIEGAECIDTDFNALEILHAAGLRSLGPVWSRHNAFGHGAPMTLQTDLDPGKGLSPKGFELIHACDHLGIMIDLSHLTEAGFWDVAKTTTRPLIATHSNAHAISPNARNLTNRQLAAVAESKGVVGLNFHVQFLRADCKMDKSTPINEMIRHLDHLLGFLGEDGVAIGSDFDGCVLPAEIGDVTGLQKLITAMKHAQYGDRLITKICSENWLRALPQ